MSKNRFVFLIFDTFKIYPGSLNNTVSRNTICRWFIRRHFQPKTCVGFSPSIPSPWKNDTWNHGPFRFHCVVTVMFSIHPPRMKCHFVTLVRVVENISFKGGARSSYPFHPSSRPLFLLLKFRYLFSRVFEDRIYPLICTQTLLTERSFFFKRFS